MAGVGAAASTSPEAAHAASQALAAVPGETPGAAVDGMIAGVLAIATRSTSVLLGAGTILLGGTGEGLVAIDGRARQPGLGAPRPRGFQADGEVPPAARIAAPALPAALVLAHAGRGARTLNELARLAIASAEVGGRIDPNTASSIRTFGREGAQALRAGAIHDGLLQAAARSLGGVLTAADLEAVRPEIVPATRIAIETRRWALAPWAISARDALEDREAQAAIASSYAIEIVAACDAHGALAIAAVAVLDAGTALEGLGLVAPAFAHPVMRGVQRTAAGAPIDVVAPIALASRADASSIDLAIGVAQHAESRLVDLIRAISANAAILEEAFASVTGASGVLIDSKGRGRPLATTRNSSA